MNDIDELDLIELFNIFWSKKWILILCLILGCAIGFLFNTLTFVPQYSSYSTMILSKPLNATTNNAITGDISNNPDSEFSITSEDITLNKSLINTYREVMQSKRVANKVIKNLDLNMVASSIRSSLDVSQVLNSEVIKVTVTTEKPSLSMKIANEITKVFSEEIKQIYNIQNVSVIDEAEMSNIIVNDNRTQNIIIFGVIGFILSAAIVFLVSYFDTSIKTEEDILKATGLPVLAIVPKYEEENGGKDKNDRK